MSSSSRFTRLVTAAVAGLVAGVCPAIASAQEIGVKGGMNSTSMTIRLPDPVDHYWENGLVAGAWVRMRPRARVSFQIEGLFSEKGLLQIERDFGFYASDYRIRYIELPLLARMDCAPPDAKYRVHLIAGVAPAFQIGARYRDNISGRGTIDITDDVQRLDIGWVAGAGVDVGRLLWEARYTHGARAVFTSANEMAMLPSARNRTVGVVFGFRFR